MLGVFDPRRMSIAQELERLAKLHANGTLSDEEFAKAKCCRHSYGLGPAPGSRGS